MDVFVNFGGKKVDLGVRDVGYLTSVSNFSPIQYQIDLVYEPFYFIYILKIYKFYG